MLRAIKLEIVLIQEPTVSKISDFWIARKQLYQHEVIQEHEICHLNWGEVPSERL